ncbi:DNA-directed RNA polymerase subunit delta [Culicoidibacter larvae]|uniref:RNAP delta factor n=1 Tax=Culicoidibacter larvae TaxID=2579976 RepID=A0A5R8QDR7_9FIRM|nr:DNA-directed RNA polymerase subunit delta [Culicoidibacter larvae]TLG73917.1 DNA-directed RNA polymerase subunit delta [Culicoidibacter larvae]
MKLSDLTEQQVKELSLVQCAFLFLSEENKPVQFQDLASKVFEILGIDEAIDEKRGLFYTDLSVDGRFIPFPDGTWDLKNRYRFEMVQDEDFILEDEDIDVDAAADEEEISTEEAFAAAPELEKFAKLKEDEDYS